ncbi:hypothetical protein J22TS1_43990 [Siminovitchia terrae]|uniref:DUF1064 domain-containing protein n=1 Tax=Siminovitchia terrae TaxID=1914933 RepID=UPI001B26E082|nr:DUF1064 domain-containing protein [Siminovitchia terrae]GIN93348.1 hypothetical protein J22TS1_43990 [Siminovitchia terrae]
MGQRMSIAEYRKVKRKPSKYRNKKVKVDGYEFDSIAESKYYQQLKWLQECKEIASFRLQPRYLLQEAFKKGAKTHRKIEYIADFEIHHKDGSIEVVDVKGVKTDVFRMKEKMFHKRYSHKLSIVGYKNGKFEEL